MVSQADDPLLPWLQPPLLDALKLHAANALMLHGPDGNGQFPLALALARAFLCEGRREHASIVPACESCASCRLFAARTHPDLMCLVPDALREELGWAALSTEQSAADGAAKGKPSKEIRVDEIRAVVAFAQSSSARGRGKAVLIHPAERMNPIAANALLKTLEEPAGQTRYILSSHAVATLLPTVRSRCLAVPVGLPVEPVALAWLEAKGVKQAGVMLAATGGRPVESLAWVQSGVDASLWLALPGQVAQGRAETFADWPVARMIETLQKLCHDLLCCTVNAAPRFFPGQTLVGLGGSIAKLAKWSAALRVHAHQAGHPWQASLKFESLLDEARRAMTRAPPDESAPGRHTAGHASVHSPS
ncbi:MAG: DNA polymerase III subunit delta' [Burkholderiaceae bacterium]